MNVMSYSMKSHQNNYEQKVIQPHHNPFWFFFFHVNSTHQMDGDWPQDNQKDITKVVWKSMEASILFLVFCSLQICSTARRYSAAVKCNQVYVRNLRYIHFSQQAHKRELLIRPCYEPQKKVISVQFIRHSEIEQPFAGRGEEYICSMAEEWVSSRVSTTQLEGATCIRANEALASEEEQKKSAINSCYILCERYF